MEYNELKDTDAIWIPKIPEHWDLIKVRHLFKESSVKGFPNEPLLVASQEHGVVNKEVFGKRTMEATKDLQNLKLVEEGDFVISLRSFQGGIEYAHQRGIISPAYTIIKALRPINKRYFKHLFKSKPFISLMTLCVKGIRDGQNIDFPTFKGEYLPLPPIEEQAKIGAYLDRKTQQIQEFIQKKERLIELLEENRLRKILELITGKQGFNSYKDSEIDHFGEIPSHWEVKKLNLICKVTLGKMLCNENKGNYHYKKYLKSKNIGWENVILDEVDSMWFSKSEMKTYRIQKNDLLVSEGGEVGKTCLWKNELEECYIQNSVHKLTFNKDCNPIYYQYLFLILGKGGYFKSIVNQVSIAHLTREKLVKIKCLVPPIEEQDLISNNIEILNTEVAELISKARLEIDKSKEYQESLITQMITGQLKVPENSYTAV
ncbi:restriction endonuclease subunit S [Algivirga pacifica]|uniref:Type I restriction modification DNA specificity domain-containing protein n=1 Tax=Algivirga pacifica TaxID=1162670 RepID=A0ABP9DC31_9BACT